MSLSHAVVAREITRLLRTQPGTRYSDIVDLLVLHLKCLPGRIESALERMRNDGSIIASGRRRCKVYHLPEQIAGGAGERGQCEIVQRIVPASVKATISRPKFTSGIAQFVYEASRT